MLHENVKFYFKVIYPIEAHYITRQIFSLAEKRSLYEFLGINHCIGKRWLMGPFQLSLPPPWLKPLVMPLALPCRLSKCSCSLDASNLRWRKQFHRACSEAWANPKCFPDGSETI